MTNFESILVPVDFSQASANAIDRARLIAAEHRAHVTLLHVVRPSGSDRSDRTGRLSAKLDHAVREAQASLRRCVARFRDDEDARVSQAVCVGDPVEEVALAAQRADLLVMGTKRKSPLHDFLFGAPLERLLRLARRPVLLARQVPASPYTTLLVPMQSSAYSDAVARAAARLAPAASLHLLHALQSSREPMVRSAEGSIVSTWLHHARVRQRAILRMKSIAASLKASDVTVCADYGDPARLALTTGDRIGADLLVAPKDEPSSLVDFLLCATAKRLLAECRRDTLLIPRAWAGQGTTLGVVPRFDAAGLRPLAQ